MCFVLAIDASKAVAYNKINKICFVVCFFLKKKFVETYFSGKYTLLKNILVFNHI